MLRGVQAARSNQNQANSTLSPISGRLAEQHDHAKSLQRRLDQYTSTVKMTRELIDLGRAPDFQMALRQLQQCEEIVDKLETELLELFDSIETSEASLNTAQQCASEAAEARQRAEQRASDQTAPLSTQLAAALEQISLRRQDVPTHLLEWYDRLRATDRVPISEVREKTCTACRMQTPDQIMREIQAGKRVHRCRNCSRFLWIRTP
jgi:predicted  nucleic acid-binding Zn-ribbon protein